MEVVTQKVVVLVLDVWLCVLGILVGVLPWTSMGIEEDEEVFWEQVEGTDCMAAMERSFYALTMIAFWISVVNAVASCYYSFFKNLVGVNDPSRKIRAGLLAGGALCYLIVTVVSLV